MSLSIFYTPDGHRRFASEEGISISAAYKAGVAALVDEIIEPTINEYSIDRLDIFCLSNRNLINREAGELDDWLTVGMELLDQVVEHCSTFANIATVGSYLPNNLSLIRSPDAPTVRFFIGNSIEDTEDIRPVDIFIRSGGQMRLSGAPRALLGDDTEICSIPTLHPRIKFREMRAVIDAYHARYIRYSDSNLSRRIKL